jgi:hypothetical protein
MTVLKRVSQKEMKRRTGFGRALGYTFPDKDEILIRKDLPKDLEHEVIAHEEAHLEKGEEGPWVQFIPQDRAYLRFVQGQGNGG